MSTQSFTVTLRYETAQRRILAATDDVANFDTRKDAIMTDIDAASKKGLSQTDFFEKIAPILKKHGFYQARE